MSDKVVCLYQRPIDKIIKYLEKEQDSLTEFIGIGRDEDGNFVVVWTKGELREHLGSIETLKVELLHATTLLRSEML